MAIGIWPPEKARKVFITGLNRRLATSFPKKQSAVNDALLYKLQIINLGLSRPISDLSSHITQPLIKECSVSAVYWDTDFQLHPISFCLNVFRYSKPEC